MKYGVEIEMVVDGEFMRDEMCIALKTHLEGVTIKPTKAGEYKTYRLCNGWKVSFDPCLRDSTTPTGNCVEIISPILYSETEPARLWESVCSAARFAKAQVTPICGMHVHTDAEGWTNSELVKLCNVVENVLPVYVSDARKRWAKPIPKNIRNLKDPTDDELRAAWYADWPNKPIPKPGTGHYHPARHRVVNLGSVWYRGTIEFRMFDATIDPNIIHKNLNLVKGWLDLAKNILE